VSLDAGENTPIPVMLALGKAILGVPQFFKAFFLNKPLERFGDIR
jgi:hypothetical protein